LTAGYDLPPVGLVAAAAVEDFCYERLPPPDSIKVQNRESPALGELLGVSA
jgi:hypothetical protein